MDIHTADLALLKQKNEEVIRKIYETNKEPFERFAKKYALSHEEVQDVYHEMIVAMYEHAVKGKLDDLRTSLRTYLFAIGKYMIYARLKKANNVMQISDLNMEESGEFNWPYEEQPGEKVLAIQQAFAQLGKKCRDLLTRYYYRDLSMKVIAEEMDYENADVVKSLKARCMKQLKSFLNPFING